MNISFILVEPAVPENVGAAARAINTMGYTDLRLVNPCNHLDNKALMLGHGSHSILENAKVFDSLKSALFDIDFAIATSAKQRWVKQDIIMSNELGSFLAKKGNTIENVAVVFGGEESGLSNDDIALCDRIASIPIANPFPSLNLGQAVMVFAYSLSQLNQQSKETDLGTKNHGYKALKDRIINLLNRIGITNSSLVHGRILERLSEVSDEDVNLLHSITSKLKDELKIIDENKKSK
jgi:tRNA/rRNA methyltransferase